MKNKYSDFGMGLFFLIISIIYYFAAKLLPDSPVNSLGPGFFPEMIAILIFILSIALMISGYGKIKESPEKATEEETKGQGEDYKTVLLTFLLAFLYTQALRPVGFLLSTTVYLFLQFIVFLQKEKRTRKQLLLLGATSVVVAVATYYVFKSGFQIMLPVGILG